MPGTCRFLIPTKLELSASVGFIHKESMKYVRGLQISEFSKKQG
jgi:hypothetical protein